MKMLNMLMSAMKKKLKLTPLARGLLTMMMQVVILLLVLMKRLQTEALLSSYVGFGPSCFDDFLGYLLLFWWISLFFFVCFSAFLQLCMYLVM